MYDIFVRWRAVIFIAALIMLVQVVYIWRTHKEDTVKRDKVQVSQGPQMTSDLFNLLQERAPDNTVTITFTNIGNIEMALNFITEAKKAGVHNYIVISFDYETCKMMPGEPCYVDPSKTFEPDKLIWGTLEYFEMINYRAYVWLLLLRHKYNIFCVDTDVFLRDNPFYYFDESYDLNIMREYPSMGTPIWLTMRQLGLCCEGDERYLNAGFFYLRSTPASIRVIEEMQKIMKEDLGVPDQDAYNIALLRVPEARVRVLNKDLFPNGFVAYLQGSPARRGIRPIVQHANWVRDHDAKTNRAREILSWHMDNTSRYTETRQYITYVTEDDVITPQMEKDYLKILYLTARMLNRTVVLPKFHCYIGEPAGCLVDSLFDTYTIAELGYLENSFLRHRYVLAQNLKTADVTLPSLAPAEHPSLKALLGLFASAKSADVARIVFPKITPTNTRHYSLDVLTDRNTLSANAKHHADDVEKLIRYNDELLFAEWYVYWRKDLAKVNYTCLVTGEMHIWDAAKHMKDIAPTNSLYVMSDNPGVPNSPALYTIKEYWGPWVVWAFDFLWPGHRLIKSHAVIVQLQIDACVDADQVFINMWEPKWLIGSICNMRELKKRTPCHYLLQDV